MKKAILSTVLIIAGLQIIYAQGTSAVDKVTKSTCDCFTKQKDNIKNEADAEKILGVCLLKAASDKLPALQKELKLKTWNEAAGNKLGQAVGLKLATECPVFLEKMMGVKTEKEAPKTQLASTEKSNFIGEVVKIETDGYTYIHIKNEAGRITKFLWLEYFKGSDDYKQKPELLIGKKVEIQWQQVEIYNAKLNDYSNEKEVMELKIN